MSTAIQLITQERKRQKSKGFTKDHDDGHRSGEINDAAICYASAAAKLLRGESHKYVQECVSAAERGFPWPWEDGYWKPSSVPIRNLVKAASLIVAEIERLQRIEQSQP